MIVAELIEILQDLPQDYVITFEYGDIYSDGYLAYANNIEVNHEVKEVKIEEI